MVTPSELRSLREDLVEFFAASAATGLRVHPLLTKKGRAWLADLRVRGPELSERGDYAARVLREVLASDWNDPATILRTNHALQILIPDYALLVEEAIQEAKFRIGAAASNVESPAEEFLRSPGGILLFGVEAVAMGLAAGEAMSQKREQAYGRIRDLELEHFDAPEDAVRGLPRIERSTGGELVFRCTGCSRLLHRAFEEAGATLLCSCGTSGRVPIPSLRRTAAHLRAKREAECGIGRCRVCRGVTQKGRGGFMAAGFCIASCAKQGRELFREHVPRSSSSDGGFIVVLCHCSRSLRARPDQVGRRIPCPECGLEVWIPRPEATRRRRAPVSCTHCGRTVRARASRCMYCGESPIS